MGLISQFHMSSSTTKRDFTVFKEDVGAGRILVTTGEIQSTNRPAVQNSVYGVGSLLLNEGKRPILCLTIYKNRQLSVARLIPRLHEDPNVMGVVTLKFVVSPCPMDLRSVQGVKTLAARLHSMLEIN